jgi:predicted permease
MTILSGPWLDQLTQDLRAAVRSLTRYPVAATVAVLSLAAGIGIASAALAIRDTIFRNPPPLYRQPEQLSFVQTHDGGPPRPVPLDLYRAWTETPNTGQQWAGVRPSRRDDVRAGDRTETLSVQAVTPNLFSVLGVQAAVGRTFDQLSSGDASSVVLSHRVWELLFDERPDAIGQTVWITDRPYIVAGVMPERFWFMSIDAFVWTALDINALPADNTLEVVVRRPGGVSESGLEVSLGPGLAEYVRTLHQTDRAIRVSVEGVGGTPISHQVALVTPFLFAGCVLLTWLICCANVAVLLIAQWTAREHEFAIRTSLGSSRGRLVRTLLTESVVIATTGGLLGLCATMAISAFIRYHSGPLTRMFDTSIHSGVIVGSVALTFLTGLLAGLAPAVYETRRLQANPLRAVASERTRQRWRHALVITEITATVALLVVAGAMIDGYRRQLSSDLGYPTHSLLVVTVENPEGVPAEPILASLTSNPDITTAAAASSAPFGAGLTLPAAPVALDAGGANAVRAARSLVSPRFFETLGVRMRAGRAFVDDDRSTAPTVAIVNESLASRLLTGQNPIGAHLWLDRTGYEVVGVVADYLPFPLSRPAPAMYLPLAANGGAATRLVFVVRTPTAMGPLVVGLRRDIPRVGRGTVVARTTNVDEILAIGAQETLAGTAPLLPLIAVGIALTSVGVYAVLAFAVARRSKELAVRVAMGATRRDIARIVATLTFRLIAMGSLLGTGATFALSRVVRASGGAGSIYDTPSWPAFVLPALILTGVGLLAMWIPSRRALRIEPAALLRVD